MAADDDDAKGDPDDGADLGGRSERVDESHSSYKQRMLRQRIEQALAEAEVAKQQLASYRAYQQRELDEVRQATAEQSPAAPRVRTRRVVVLAEPTRLFDDTAGKACG